MKDQNERISQPLTITLTTHSIKLRMSIFANNEIIVMPSYDIISGHDLEHVVHVELELECDFHRSAPSLKFNCIGVSKGRAC